MAENINPPIGPNSALPKSRATVLLLATVACCRVSLRKSVGLGGPALSSTAKYDTFADRNSA